MKPEAATAIRHELGAALMEFMTFLIENQAGPKDDVLRQVATDKYRRVVMSAAARGVEMGVTWNLLATWTEESKERIGNFSRALACLRAESVSPLPGQIQDPWCNAYFEALCLYEIGRIHAHESSTEAARRFLEEALPLAQQAEALRDPAKRIDPGLEGKIAALLVQL